MINIKSSRPIFFKTCFITTALLFAMLVCFGQQQKIDSLKNLLQKSGQDTGRVNLLLNLSSYSSAGGAKANELNNALAYAAQAEKLSTSLTRVKGLGKSYMALANVWSLKKDSSKCIAYTQKAITIFLKNKFIREAAEAYLKCEEFYNVYDGREMDKRIAYYSVAAPLFHQAGAKDREAATLSILGDFYQVMGKQVKGMEALKRALALYQEIKYPRLQATYDLLGSILTEMGDYREGLRYALLAAKTAEALKDTSMLMCTIYNRLGLTYYSSNQLESARVYFQRSLLIAEKYKDINSVALLTANSFNTLMSLGRYNEALNLLTWSQKKFPATDPFYIARLDACFLLAYNAADQVASAQQYCDKLLVTLNKPRKEYENRIIILNAVTKFYIHTKQVDTAQKYLNLYRAEYNNATNERIKAGTYFYQFQIDSIRGNYLSAIKNLHRSVTIRDSLYSEGKSKQIAQMNVQYQTEQKDLEIKTKQDNINLLTRQSQLQRTNLRQEKTTQKLIIAGTILLALLLALSYNRYLLKQRINKQLQAQQKEISLKNQSLVSLVMEKDGLLEEKEWLMKEIHHRVKNNLQIVISLLNTQSAYLDNDVAFNAIRESQHRMQSISLIHQKLYQSENLALVDVQAYISDLIAYLQDSFDTGTRISFETDIVAAELDVTRAVPLGLILNEAITNSIKYAFPNKCKGQICISLKQADDAGFVLRIKDNGIGLQSAVDVTKSKSLGMSLMRGLSKQLGGSFAVDSNQGMTITVAFVNDKVLKAI